MTDITPGNDDGIRGHIDGWDWGSGEACVTLHITVPSMRLGKFDDKKPVILSQITEKESVPMPDQVPVADDDRTAYRWAETHQNDTYETLAAVSRSVLAHVPAPPKSLSEELRAYAHQVIGADGYPLFGGDSEILALADRAEAVEKDRDEARAEAERLSRESVARLDQINALESKVGRMLATGSTYPADTLPDPADVPEGECWLIEFEGKHYEARRNRTGFGGHTWYFFREGPCSAKDSEVTLVARLVPDVRRVIDRPEDLDKLPAGSIVLDGDGDPWKKSVGGHWYLSPVSRSASYLLDRYGPVTVIHEPEVTA